MTFYDAFTKRIALGKAAVSLVLKNSAKVFRERTRIRIRDYRKPLLQALQLIWSAISLGQKHILCSRRILKKGRKIHVGF